MLAAAAAEGADGRGAGGTSSVVSQMSAHCKKRQRERGISDTEIERALQDGERFASQLVKKRYLHVGGGITVVTGSNVAVTAWRSGQTCHPEDAFVAHRICDYGDSSASDIDDDESEEGKSCREESYYGQAWTSRPSCKYWSCCAKKVQAAGEEDGCEQCAGVEGLSHGARKKVYVERSKVLKANAEARASSPELDDVDEGNPYDRPWDDSIGDDASPHCDCGYADGVYPWCACVGQVKTWDCDSLDESDSECSSNEACSNDEEFEENEEEDVNH